MIKKLTTYKLRDHLNTAQPKLLKTSMFMCPFENYPVKKPVLRCSFDSALVKLRLYCTWKRSAHSGSPFRLRLRLSWSPLRLRLRWSPLGWFFAATLGPSEGGNYALPWCISETFYWKSSEENDPNGSTPAHLTSCEHYVTSYGKVRKIGLTIWKQIKTAS